MQLDAFFAKHPRRAQPETHAHAPSQETDELPHPRDEKNNTVLKELKFRKVRIIPIRGRTSWGKRARAELKRSKRMRPFRRKRLGHASSSPGMKTSISTSGQYEFRQGYRKQIKEN